MAGRLEGKVALVSGAGRGQGRSHAVRLAEEGADIVAFDVCRQLDTVPYPMAVLEDLKQTARQCRRWSTLGVSDLGSLDIVCANAGIVGFADNSWSLTEEQWDEMIAVNLSGVWRAVKAAIPAMINAGNGDPS